MIELSPTKIVLILHLLCFARWLVMIFFIAPAKTLESIVNGNNTAINTASKILSDFFESSVRVFFDKIVKLLKLFVSKGWFSSLILWPWSNRTFLGSLLPELLYPSSCNLKLLCNLFETVLAGIISRQNTFS